MSAPEFNVGDYVEKFGGDYQIDGIVVARFCKLDKQLRYVVEFGGGILHIFAPRQLRAKQWPETADSSSTKGE